MRSEAWNKQPNWKAYHYICPYLIFFLLYKLTLIWFYPFCDNPFILRNLIVVFLEQIFILKHTELAHTLEGKWSNQKYILFHFVFTWDIFFKGILRHTCYFFVLFLFLLFSGKTLLYHIFHTGLHFYNKTLYHSW